jgi:hypothetical protein
MFMDEGGRVGGVEVLPEGCIHEAWTPQPSKPDQYAKGFGFY